MYAYIRGLVSEITPSHIMVETRDGVGYYLFVGNPYSFEEGQAAKIYVQQIVRENEISLYGFAGQTEKILFNKLLSVSGIGPKSALAIIAGGAVTGLAEAVGDDNLNYLVQFPGIGKKTAQQIILDLKGKLDDVLPATVTTPKMQGSGDNQALADALAALLTLGYSNRDIASVKKQLSQAESASTEEYISMALSLLVKG